MLKVVIRSCFRPEGKTNKQKKKKKIKKRKRRKMADI